MTFNRTAACLFSTFHNLTFRIADQNKAAGRRTLRVVCHSAFEDLGTVLL
jgi:hypothetical protein